jgi:hypothetical protein
LAVSTSGGVTGGGFDGFEVAARLYLTQRIDVTLT